MLTAINYNNLMIGEINKHVYYKPNMLTLYNSAF